MLGQKHCMRFFGKLCRLFKPFGLLDSLAFWFDCFVRKMKIFRQKIKNENTTAFRIFCIAGFFEKNCKNSKNGLTFFVRCAIIVL